MKRTNFCLLSNWLDSKAVIISIELVIYFFTSQLIQHSLVYINQSVNSIVLMMIASLAILHHNPILCGDAISCVTKKKKERKKKRKIQGVLWPQIPKGGLSVPSSLSPHPPCPARPVVGTVYVNIRVSFLLIYKYSYKFRVFSLPALSKKNHVFVILMQFQIWAQRIDCIVCAIEPVLW